MLLYSPLTHDSGEKKMATTKHNKIKLREVNRHLVCRLCRGYYIDATTIAECLHSFCRSCIIQYLEKNSFCPICEVQIHKTKPYLSLRLDKALQDVVYKVVPGLYHDEMRRRREFYSEQKERIPAATPEQCGLEERIIFSPEDSISLSLEYLDSDYLENETVSSQSSESGDTQDGFVLSQHLNLKLRANDKSSRRESQDTQEPSCYPKRYLQCPAVVNVGHLKKFVRMKHELHSKTEVDIIHKRVPLPDHYTLMDVAYIYTWKRSAPLRLFYQIYKTKKQKVIVPPPVAEAKNTESHPLKDLSKDKNEVNSTEESVSVVNHESKVNKNDAAPNHLGKASNEVQNASDLINPSSNKSDAENKTKETAKAMANVNEESNREEPSSGKDKTISPLKSKTSDKVKPSDKVPLEIKSKTEKSGISKVQKLSEEVKENKLSNNERLLLNPVSGQLESVPFDDCLNTAAVRVEEMKDKFNGPRKENETKKESGGVKKIKVNKSENENVKKEKMNKKELADSKKEKVNKKERMNKKESANVRKEKSNKKDSENTKKETDQKKDSENVRKGNECEKTLESPKKENEQKKTSVADNMRNEKEQNKESENLKKAEEESVKKQMESCKEAENVVKEKEKKKDSENSVKEKEPKKEEETEKKSNLNVLKNFRKEKQLTKEAKIELKSSNGTTLTITALPRADKSAEAENSKVSTEAKEANVYDFDKSGSSEKSELFGKQVKISKSKYLMEHRDKWLAKEAASEWMTFQEYRGMLLKENSATENLCTRAKRKSVPNLFKISPEENKRPTLKEHVEKPEENLKEKKSSSGIYNIQAKDEDKKTGTPKNNRNSPPRPIKIENKDGEYFIKHENQEINGKSPEVEKQKIDDRYAMYQKLMENYQAKVEEVNKKSKTDESGSKNFGPIDLTKGENSSKERKNVSETVNDKPNKTSFKQEDKPVIKVNPEQPLLKVPQYSQNVKNSTDWQTLAQNISPNELSQAFLHLKHLDAINQFNPNAVLEQFAKKTGNLDLLYQQKIDFIRRLKRHQQASEDIAPEKKAKFSPPGDKKHSPSLDLKGKTRPTSEELAALKNAEDLKTLSRIQDLLEIQRAVTQNFKMPPALLQFYNRPRPPYPPPIPPSLSNPRPTSHPTKPQNLGSPSGSLPLPIPNASFLDSPNYGHLLSAAGLHTEMSFHQTFKNYLRRQEDNPNLSNILKKPPRLKEESGKSVSDKHHNSKAATIKQESADAVDAPET